MSTETSKDQNKCGLYYFGLVSCEGVCEKINIPGNPEPENQWLCRECQKVHCRKLLSRYKSEVIRLAARISIRNQLSQKERLVPVRKHLCVTENRHLLEYLEFEEVFGTLPSPCEYTDRYNKFCEKQCQPIAKANGLCDDNGIVIFGCVWSSENFKGYKFRELGKASPDCQQKNWKPNSSCKKCWNSIMETHAAMPSEQYRRTRGKLGFCFDAHGALFERDGVIKTRYQEEGETTYTDPQEPLREPSPTPQYEYVGISF